MSAVATPLSLYSPQRALPGVPDTLPLPRPRIGYKLFRVRRDGSLGPLFINRRQRIWAGDILKAEDHPTRGFAHRPGWHICSSKSAPHLKEHPVSGPRQWFRVEFWDANEHKRPARQGGLWFTAAFIRVLEPV